MRLIVTFLVNISFCDNMEIRNVEIMSLNI